MPRSPSVSPSTSHVYSYEEVNRQIRESLGLPPKPEIKPALPVEGHVCEFPLWAFSKKRSTVQDLHITYEDGSFLTIKAPEGMPGPRFPDQRGHLNRNLRF